jgi:transcription antitermination factor NusG
MLMATEPKIGNLEQVYEATTPAEIVREQQRYPFKGWYAIIVRSSREQDAADGFRRSNVLAYWPNFEKQILINKGRLGHRRRRVIFAPIIPGLIFCPTADADLFWAVIKRVPYVLNLMRKFSGDVVNLANEDIDIIRLIEAGLNTPDLPIKTLHNFKMGEKVRFIDDINGRWPPGKIIELYDDGRITIETTAMGRAVPIRNVLPYQIERI